MTALLIFGIVALILTVSFGVVITVLVSKALTDAFRTVNSIHTSNSEQVDKLLDRLVAIDWERYVTLQAYKDPDEGGFYAPTGQEEEGGIEARNGLGHLQRLREPQGLTADEERLLAEDFPDERSAS